MKEMNSTERTKTASGGACFFAKQGFPDENEESPLPQAYRIMENRNYTVEQSGASK
jgi:hypothetical protein